MRKLSQIAAGVMNWGVWGKNLDHRSMSDLINVCASNGITTFDHADIYGGYTTEAQFGDAFSGSGVSRQSVELVTKCGIQHISGRENRIKHYDYSADYIKNSVDTSLTNLKTDYLDVLLLHRPSPLMEPDEVAGAIEGLKREGKILSFGVSNFTPFQTELLRQRITVEFNQIEFSATHLEPLTDGNLDYMQIHKIRPMAWSPLGTVFRESDERSARIMTVLNRIAAENQTAPDVILIAWILKHPAQIIPVCGTADRKRIENLPRALEISLSLTDWFEIWEAGRGTKVP